jgi:hypothetical protein
MPTRRHIGKPGFDLAAQPLFGAAQPRRADPGRSHGKEFLPNDRNRTVGTWRAVFGALTSITGVGRRTAGLSQRSDYAGAGDSRKCKSDHIGVSASVRAFERRFLALRLCIQKFRSRRLWLSVKPTARPKHGPFAWRDMSSCCFTEDRRWRSLIGRNVCQSRETCRPKVFAGNILRVIDRAANVIGVVLKSFPAASCAARAHRCASLNRVSLKGQGLWLATYRVRAFL